MERNEPALVPEWLKGSTGGGSGSGGATHHSSLSSLSADEASGTISTRSRSSGIGVGDHDNPRFPNFMDRTSVLHGRRSSSSNSVHDKDISTYSRSYSSFCRRYDGDRDRDWERDIDSRDKEPSLFGDRDHVEARGNSSSIFGHRVEKEFLKRSQSMVSGKRGESLPRKTGSDMGSLKNGLLVGGGLMSSINKAAFERDFPSLGVEEKQGMCTNGVAEIGRATSPVLTPVAQSLPLGTSSVIGGDGWTSALAEVPVIIGNNACMHSSVPPVMPATPVSSVAPNSITGLNMAETLAQAPTRSRALPQLQIETQRLEEFAIKQSRQLIPMTPSMPKTLVLSPSEKPKPKVTSGATKVGQLPTSSPLLNSSLRGPTIRPDPQKPSQPGKLLVLKPSREKNGISSIPKESTSPSNPITRIANAPLTVIPAAPRNPKAASTDDKRPTSQAQNRSDFFNSLRKKTSSNLTPRPASMEKSDRENPITTVERTDEEARDCLAPEKDRAALPANGDAHEDCAGLGEESVKNQASNSVSIIVGSEEEEAAFLRSLGWEENAGEEALTEEEINAFYKEHMKLRPSTSLRRGACQLGSSAIKNA
ncbi:uncharacterized protein LOC18995740 isoform X3 [Amborella trichopoda]|uniref:uncharacterized protein LOC18995740 isoform X3 n=1 Tax=Amborella trichopoda TaxID=13333 RepID=UPI0009C0B195|nr:uncharacterized protein LOC18995740 isoform X3 [Amborella trichopoda]|eukprot:XP_020524291.1 uncharacterized protein LOC18995740 isoform X3 [Amborella trichopoda]